MKLITTFPLERYEIATGHTPECAGAGRELAARPMPMSRPGLRYAHHRERRIGEPVSSMRGTKFNRARLAYGLFFAGDEGGLAIQPT